jgi:hypothetical protein
VFNIRNCLPARKLQKICRIALIRHGILVIFARLQKVDGLQMQQERFQVRHAGPSGRISRACPHDLRARRNDKTRDHTNI